MTRIRLSAEVRREVFRCLVRASSARHLARFAAGQGDLFKARCYRDENRSHLGRARLLVERDLFAQLKAKTAALLAQLDKDFPCLSKREKDFSKDDFPAEQVSVSAARPGLRVQRMFRGSLANKTATIALAITAMPGLRTGWTARPRKWPLVLHSGNSVCEAYSRSSSAKVLD